MSSKCYNKVTWIVQFRDLMENSLTANHTIHDFRNELLNFCLSIKLASNISIIKDIITLSPSSHDIKLNSCIRDKSSTPY